MADQVYTVNEAAEMLELSRSRIMQFIYEKRLPAVKVGRDWIINRFDLVNFMNKQRPAGRPKQQTTN